MTPWPASIRMGERKKDPGTGKLRSDDCTRVDHQYKALEAPILGGTSSVDWGLGDKSYTYSPSYLRGWHTPRADFTAGLGIFAPTGSHYEVGGDNNTGLGMWSYEIFGGTTLYLDQDRTWSFAATAFFDLRPRPTGRKRIRTFESAMSLLTIEGGLGKSFLQGAASAGVAYYGQWKLSSDDLGFDPAWSSCRSPVERRLPEAPGIRGRPRTDVADREQEQTLCPGQFSVFQGIRRRLDVGGRIVFVHA